MITASFLFMACGKNEIHIRLEHAGGLSINDPVLSSGLQIGRVKELKIVGVKPLATIKLNKDIRIPIDSKVELISIDIPGSRAISIDLSENSQYYSRLDTLICTDKSRTVLDSIMIGIGKAVEDKIRQDTLPE